MAHARKKVRIERRHGLEGLDEILRDEPATTIISLTFPTRAPHSVCVSHHGSDFILRDSAATSRGQTADGRGTAVAELLAQVPSNGTPGDVIVFRSS
jgi:hypothetical protein